MSDPYQYYRNVIDAALAVNDEEERGLITANGIKELVERDEVEATSRDIAGSRIVQKLVELAPTDGESLALLAPAFAKNWFALATDRFSSYVLEDYLKRLAAIPSAKLSENEVFTEFFKTVCKITRLNNDECLPHARASHVTRGLICSLAGVKVFPKGVGDESIRILSPEISEEFKKRLVTLTCSMTAGKVVTKTALFSRLCNEYAAPVYCTLLKVAKYRFTEDFRQDFCKTLTKCIHSERPDADSVCRDEVLSHVLNDIIMAVPAPSDLFDKLMRRYLGVDKEDEEDRIKSMAVDPIANYTVQTALRALTEAEEFSTFSEPILNSMTGLFNAGCLGVVTQLVRAATRLLSPSSGMPPFTKQLHSELCRVLSCNTPERLNMLVPALFFYLPFDHLPKHFEINDPEQPHPNLPGCLLLEALFSTPDPSLYLTSLTSVPNGFLPAMSSTAEGYHVIAQIVASKNVTASSKAEIVAVLAPSDPGQEKLLPTALTHFGCLTYKALWDSLPAQREVLASYLSKFADTLRDSKYGRFLFAAFALRLFTLNVDRWKDLKVAPDTKTKQSTSSKGDRFDGRNFDQNRNKHFQHNSNSNNSNNYRQYSGGGRGRGKHFDKNQLPKRQKMGQ